MGITNIGDSQTFDYTGDIQQFIVPKTGIYKLEVYGAQGATSGGAGGKGGYSSGYIILKSSSVLYIGVGGQGSGMTGGFNGGGNGSKSSYTGSAVKNGGGGGGATHIATMEGTLASIGKDNLSKVFIIAGGGGGGAYIEGALAGGTGGGISGGAGAGSHSSQPGATQTTGYAFGQGQNGIAGASASWGEAGRGGGGGGLYGGNASQYVSGGVKGGGGGSGYIGNVPEFTHEEVLYSPSTTNGSRSGNGSATITLIARTFPDIFLGETAVYGMYLGSKELDTFFKGLIEL